MSALPTTSTSGGTITRRWPALTASSIGTSCPVKSTPVRSTVPSPRSILYWCWISATELGVQTCCPSGFTSTRSAALLIASTTLSSAPTAISPRARPNHVPTTRAAPTTASAAATYPLNPGLAPSSALAPTSPSTINIAESATRPSRERGFGGLAGGCGGCDGPGGTGGCACQAGGSSQTGVGSSPVRYRSASSSSSEPSRSVSAFSGGTGSSTVSGPSTAVPGSPDVGGSGAAGSSRVGGSAGAAGWPRVAGSLGTTDGATVVVGQEYPGGGVSPGVPGPAGGAGG